MGFNVALECFGCDQILARWDTVGVYAIKKPFMLFKGPVSRSYCEDCLEFLADSKTRNAAFYKNPKEKKCYYCQIKESTVLSEVGLFDNNGSQFLTHICVYCFNSNIAGETNDK